MSPPPPKSLGGLHAGIGAGSAVGIEGAAGFGAERRFGAALRAIFFLAGFFFADAFTVLRFLRAGAVFFFLVDRFFAFAFVLFAMMDLPILVRFKLVLPPRRFRRLTRAYDTSHPGRGQAFTHRPLLTTLHSAALLSRLPSPATVAGRIAGFVARCERCPCSIGGQGPPVAQSINSTVWTAGSSVPAAI